MKSNNLLDELGVFAKEIRQNCLVPFKFYFWDIPESRRKECEGLFDFVKDVSYSSALGGILKNNEFGVEYALNKYGFYTLIRFIKGK